MELLPLFIFWCLWFLNRSTWAIFSPILPMILVTLILQATFSLAFFPVGLATISKLSPFTERSMSPGVIISIGMIFGTGAAPFILGVTADHFNFQIGILWLGVLTTLSSVSVSFLKEA